MRNVLIILIVMGALLNNAVPVAAQEPGPAALRVARFHGDKAAAVSLTFDDGLRNQDEVGVPLTVLVPAAGATAPEARREGEAGLLPVRLAGEAIQVEVVPGPGPVTVTWKMPAQRLGIEQGRDIKR